MECRLGKKEASIIVFMLVLLTMGMLSLAFNIQPVKSEWTGTVYIRADGSIDPPDAPIITYDNVTYMLTSNITSSGDGIVVERDNIIIDGGGHMLQGNGSGWGIDLYDVKYVTVKNIDVNGFYIGVILGETYNVISGSDITNNYEGIGLGGAFHQVVKNNFANNYEGISVNGVHHSIHGNSLTNNTIGILLDWGSSNNDIVGNTISRSGDGGGIQILQSSDNTIIGNNIINNFGGIAFYKSSCIIYHNNFINNTHGHMYPIPPTPGVNIWDDGYPSGGNFWSDYVGVDVKSGFGQDLPGSDGIGDTPYVIDENNRDRYPLMASLNIFNAGTWGETTFFVDIISNSTVSDFQFNPYEYPPHLKFNVTGANGSSGFCRVTIPEHLLWAQDENWKVFVGGDEVNYTLTQDEHNTYLYFTYLHSTKTVIIEGTETSVFYYNLTITSTEGGTTDPPLGIRTYVNGTQVSVTATPNNGFSFNCWLLDGEKRTENPITITMDSNHALEAYFVDDIKPDIGDPWQDPLTENVQAFQNVTVWVNVTDYGTRVKNVTLWYSLDNGTSWKPPINMTALPIPSDTTITYEATIPGYKNCMWIAYKIIAYDKAGNNQTKDNNGYFYKYHVIPESPLSVALFGLLALMTIPLVFIRKKRYRKTKP